MSTHPDTTQLIEDEYKLRLAMKLLKDVSIDSVNDHKSGDAVGDRTATDGLYYGTYSQVRRWHKVAWDKVRRLHV